MKNIIIIILISIATATFAQKVDADRMNRDLEIAENALATMIKQQFSGRDNRGIWIDVKANYTPGFGVTMRIPNDNANWIYEYSYKVSGGDMTIIAPASPGGYGVTMTYNDDKQAYIADKDRDKVRKVTDERRDSSRTVYYNALVKASKEFLADYGDLISQLAPEEKILITNRGEGGRYNYARWEKGGQKRMLVTIDATKGDISSFRQGKITRDQMLSKIKVVNTESTDEVETDLELFSSIIGRLYRSDLAKTYYTDENIYYERLKDFGVIYYMSAYSSTEQNRHPGDKTQGKMWQMPTQRVEGLTQEQRDKKVAELYPLFEKEIKENIVEYAQTIKSLKDDEMIVFNIQITKCTACNIPSSLELSVKNGLVRKLVAGQSSKADVISSISVKKGSPQ